MTFPQFTEMRTRQKLKGKVRVGKIIASYYKVTRRKSPGG